MDITPLRIQSCLMSCINKVIFLCFCNKLKFHILSRDGKMLRLSPSIKILVLSKVDIALLCCQLSMYFVDVFNVSLQDRLTAPPSRLSGVCPRPSFPGAEEFFSELISAADSHTLNRHLSDAILTKITEVSIYVDLCLSEWVQWIRDVIKISLHASYQYSCMVWTAGRYIRQTHVRSMHLTSGVCMASNGIKSICSEQWCTEADEATQTHCYNRVSPTYSLWAHCAHRWQRRCQEDPVSRWTGEDNQDVPASYGLAPSNKI